MSGHISILNRGFCGMLAFVGMTGMSDQFTVAELPQPARSEGAGEIRQPVEATRNPSKSVSSPYVELAPTPASERAGRERIRQAMEKQVTLDFKDLPLDKAVAAMADKAGIKIQINATALAEEGIALDERMTLSLPVPIRHRYALELLLEPLALTWVVRGNAVVVTTEIEAEDAREIRYYPVHKLRDLGFPLESLESLVRNETGGPWLAVDGFGGEICVLPGILAVNQNERVHRQIADVLKTLERVGSGDEKSGFAPLFNENNAAYAALNRKVSISLDDVPISQLPARLQKAAGVNFVVDHFALVEEGIEPETTVSIHVKDLPLRIALTKVLEPLDMTLVAHRGVVIITTKITAEERLDTLLYNIRDFVEASYDVDMMSDLIQSATWGPWSDIDGTGGTITPLEPGFLVVRQTMRNHRQAAAALNRVRTLLRKTSPDGTLPQAIVSDELIVKYYMMRDRVPEIEGKANGLPVEQVRDAIPKFVAPKSWKINGGRGDISVVNSTLVIRQTARVHRKVRRFLQTLRRETLIQFLTGDTPLSDPAPTTPAP